MEGRLGTSPHEQGVEARNGTLWLRVNFGSRFSPSSTVREVRSGVFAQPCDSEATRQRENRVLCIRKLTPVGIDH